MSSDDDAPSNLPRGESPNLALSVRQPWAELILSGRKSIEIRGWATDHRGPVWLHTGQKRDPEAEAYFGLHDLFYGGFVGRVEVSSVIRLDPERWERWRTRHLVPGPMPSDSYAWLLQSPVRLSEPVVAPGDLRLFLPKSETLALLQRAL